MKKNNNELIALIIIVLIVSYLITKVFYGIAAMELSGAYNYDTQLYLTVGRGILNGLKPYVEMYENKPPLIFLLSALSLKLTNDTTIGNLFELICLIITFIIPVIISAKILEKKKLGKTYCVIGISFTILFSLMLTYFSAYWGGRYQVECMGTGLLCIYMYIIFSIDSKNIKWYSWKLALAGVFVMSATMLKEPFIIVAFALALVYTKNWQDFLKKILIPFIWAGILSIILLIVMGCFKEYFSIYINNMIFNHVGNNNSPILRAFNIKKIIIETSKMSSIFAIIIWVCPVIMIINEFKFKNIVKVLLIIYLMSFSVGLGGNYWNHHYVFAFPVFIAMYIFMFQEIVKEKMDDNFKFIIIIIMFLMMIDVTRLKTLSMECQYWKEEHIKGKIEARYIDDILDYYNIDSYLYIGFNDRKIFGLTRSFAIRTMFRSRS